MPIKDFTIYPPYWDQFSRYIRFERAKGFCEQCGIENYATTDRGTTVVLTVAHLDHEGGPCRCKAETGLKCADPSHCLALCQRCHLQLDMPKHIERRRETLRERNDAERGLFTNA